MSYTLYTHKRVYTQCDCCSFMCGKGQLQGAAVKNWSRYVLLAWAVAFLILGLTHRRIKICIPIHTCMHACMHSHTVIKCHWIWHSVDCQLHWGASGLVGSRLSMFTGFMKTKLFMGFSYISSSLSHFFLLLILLTVTLSLLLFLIFSFLFSSVLPPLISLPFQPCPFSFLSLIFIFILFSFAFLCSFLAAFLLISLSFFGEVCCHHLLNHLTSPSSFELHQMWNLAVWTADWFSASPLSSCCICELLAI